MSDIACAPSHTSEFLISADHPALPGHFPGRPLVPAVVILDRVIEAAEAWCGPAFKLGGLPQAKFLAPLLPGEAATVTLVRRDAMLDFTVHRATTLVSRGTLALRADRGS